MVDINKTDSLGASKGEAARTRENAGRRAAVAALKTKFKRYDFLLLAGLFLALALVPFLPNMRGWMLAQGSMILVYVIAALGIMVLLGFVGLVSVGHGGFLAIGAYTSALLTIHYGVDLVVGIFAGMLMSAFIGTLLALIFLRLSGAFMAIGTLGFAFFVGTIVNNVPLFQGRDGILLPRNVVLGMEVRDQGFYYASLACLVLVSTFIYALRNSGTGRAFMALRDAEKAGMASGINRLKYRTLAFAISAGITGIAGALSAHVVSYVSAEVYGDIWYSVDILIAAVVGGSLMVIGPMIGGLFVVLVPFFFEQLADFSFILKGVVLILVLRFAPAGVSELLFRPFKNARLRAIRAAGGSMIEAEAKK